MNKGELVDAIASSANISKTDAENALNAFIDTVQNSVSSGDKVTLPGFGSFQPTLRKARTGIDPTDSRTRADPGTEGREVHRGLEIQSPGARVLIV